MGRVARLEARFVDPMHCVQWHREDRSVKHGGFVHVVPKAGNAIFDKLRVQITPPFTCLGASEVRKYCGPRPHHADKFAAVWILYEMVTRMTSVIRHVAITGDVGNMQIRNRDKVKILFAEIEDEFRKFWKPDGINRE